MITHLAPSPMSFDFLFLDIVKNFAHSRLQSDKPERCKKGYSDLAWLCNQVLYQIDSLEQVSSIFEWL